MSAEDRDPKFERALAQHFPGSSPHADCPDAETLAAYHERSLSLDEMAHWKRHFAGCAACQETLSLLEVTEKQLAEDWEEREIPVLDAAAGREAAPKTRAAAARLEVEEAAASASAPLSITRKRRPALIGWAIPLGAVAAGVLVWIGIHERGASPTARVETDKVQVAENRPQPTPAGRQYEAVPAPATPGMRDDELKDIGRQAARNAPPAESASADQTRERAKAMAQATPNILRKDERGARKEPAPEAPALGVGMGAGSAAPAPMRAGKEQAPPSVTETVEVTSAAPSVSTSGEPVDLPGDQAGSAVEDKKRVAAMSKPKAAMQQSAELDSNAMAYKQGVNGRSVSSLNNLAPGVSVIVTPNPKIWWKIAGPGTVELTTDAGKKWKTLDTGVTSQLTAGSAPSSKVCWLAGQGGTLLLTTDRGNHWTKIAAPIAGDLGGVHAVDARHATIWDTANRLSFETSDAGAAWKQIANE
jgi:hypothetical protein